MKISIGLGSVAVLVASASYAQDSSPARTAKTVIALRGAPCGDITGAVEDPNNGNILAECSNGMIYGVMWTNDRKGRFLVRRNSLNGKFEVY